MVIHFSINYNTVPGQDLYIIGSIPELGNGNPAKAVSLHYTQGGWWKTDLKLGNLEERVLRYKYFIRSQDGNPFYEAGKERIIGLHRSVKELFCNDEWHGNSDAAPFLTSPFSGIFYPLGKGKATQTHLCRKEVILRVIVPNVGPECEVRVCGNCSTLGNWDPARALKMTPADGSGYLIHLEAGALPEQIEYKFLKLKGTDIEWEDCLNHRLSLPALQDNSTCIAEHSMAAFRTGHPKFAGTAVPVFSLRTATSCGIGDFTDLRMLGDWAKRTGQSILQILPINDTTSTGTWTDSYPYGSITVMALHPIYINITAIGPLKNPGQRAAYGKGRKALDQLPAVDFEKVLQFKQKYLRIQFADYAQDTFAEPDFLSFYRRNREWLLPYCAFCTLRDKYGTADYSTWGGDATYSPELIHRLNDKHSPEYEEISFHIFVQYHLHRQLSDSVEYLHSLGIALKGDIPIGITRNSVDAWTFPGLFNLNSQAGAPPDAFSAKGQNWGFPTYNWDRMSEDGYRWWKQRFVKMSEYFDAYRIDHVLGFFRIWEIPATQTTGLMGHFSPALPLSIEEILGSGFRFDYSRHATPYIRYHQLKEMFGEDTETVMQTYLDSPFYDIFQFKPEFDNQKKIEDHFGSEHNNIKDGLMALAAEVLFMEDERQRGKFHPRISAQHTFSYRDLPEDQKACFNRIYDDFFYRRHDEFWRQTALRKLPELISATNMLTCAEDLGMIPGCVPGVIRDLHILSLEIFRMSKDPKEEFSRPSDYPYLSVCTTGTHDTDTLRGWWEADREASTHFWHNILGENGTPPYFCEPWLCERILRMHTKGASMLTILPLQDWLSVNGRVRAENPEAERINIPANPRHYWRWRMHLMLEDLIADEELTNQIINLIN